MGEAKKREDAAVEAAVAAANSSAQEVKPEDAAVLLAVQRITQAITVECYQLVNTYGRAEAAKKISGPIEYLNKYALTYANEARRSIVVPQTQLVMP